MIVDLDSHLRESYAMDEVYKLDAPYEEYTPVKIVDGAPHERRFETKLRETSRSAPGYSGYNHNYMYNPKENWRGGVIAARQIAGYDMAKRMEGNAAEHLDKQLIFPTGISLPVLTPGPLGAALSHSYNTWVSNLVKGFEDYLLPVAMIPAGCPDEMPNELRRSVTELGFKAAHLVCYEGEHNLDDPSFFPYYEAAQELDVPLFCHPNGHMGFITERFNNFLAMHTLGRPTNCTQALVALVAGGVFERFPRLKVAFFECSAEWPLYWMHRLDDDWGWLEDDQDRHLPVHLSMKPSDYVRRNCYVTLEADEGPLTESIEQLGADHILMATDYPHFDSEYPDTVTKIQARADLTPKQKEMVLGKNAEALLNLA
ncbi:MAG TPA: amidohydrolase family protein [Dehalococcoidia bacterium]|nr:amidohydrolase family protein [Dehalococcoidia bacterium]